MDLVRYSGSDDEWAALYVDGELDTVGDKYIIDERIRELAKVKEITSESYMRGGNHYEDVAKNISQIREYEEKQQEIERERKLNELEDIEIARVVRERIKNEVPGTRITLEELLVELNLTEDELKDD